MVNQVQAFEVDSFNKTFDRVFVTGDIHGDIYDLTCRLDDIPKPTKNDLLVILGDCGFFYDIFYNDAQKDCHRQCRAADLPITIICVQGNHEQPFKEMSATKIKLLGGEGYHSNGIYFAENGTVLNINDKTALVVGGAYSIDKQWRLAHSGAWWQNEELTKEELAQIYDISAGKHFDFVFTHTCPYNFLPREVFLYGVDQSKVSYRMEYALQIIHDAISFNKWYCGHFHTEKTDNNIKFLYQSILQII